MEILKFDINLLESSFVIDPVLNNKFSFGQLFSTANLFNIGKENITLNRINLLISSDPYFIISFILRCWLSNQIPAILSPNLNLEEYKSIIKEIKFNSILTDNTKISNQLGISSYCFSKSEIKTFREDIYFRYKLENRALILFSSGTTGRQKAIPLTFNNILSNIKSFSKTFKIKEESTFLCTSPIWFAHGLYNSFLFAFFLQKKVIYPGVLNVFNGIITLQYCLNIPNLIYHITPSMIPILTSIASRLKSKGLPKFQYVFCGTSYLDINSKLKFEEIFNVNLNQQYGMTEVLFISLNDKPITKPNSVGKPLDIVELKIKNNKSNNKNYEGKVFIKSPSFCGEYLNKSEISNIDNEGFFNSGDLGYIDLDGYLFITGRDKDLIKKGGLVISVSKLNNSILEFGNIKEAYSLGVIDKNLGEQVYSFITLEKNILLEELNEFLKVKLPHNYIPGRIFVIDKIPKNEMGKTLKNELIKIIKQQDV